MNSRERLLKVLAASAAVIIVAFFIAEIFVLTGRSYATRTVYEETVLESVDAQMYVIKDEVLLTSDTPGVTVQIADNAERVSKGSPIAAVFTSEETANNFIELQQLNKKLDVYKKIDSQLKLANIDLDKLNNEIDSDFNSILNCVYSNDFSDISELKLSFAEKISRKQISLGQTVDCSAEISEILSKIASLNSASSPAKIIPSEISGYYVGRADGYENVLTVADIDELTPEILQKAFESEKAEVPSNSIGKIISGYNWYVATVLDAADTTGFKKGKTVNLVLGDSSSSVVKTKVYSIKAVSDSKTLVVFSCNIMNDSLVSLRKVEGKVIVKEYTGLKIPKDAIRFDEEGNAGVFIRRANIVNFRSLNVLYTGSDFVVAADDDEVKLPYSHLKLYDEVIISGKDLKNGMVIG